MIKTCSKCKEEKTVDFFNRRGKAYQPWCKSCAHARRAEWARENRHKTKQYHLKYVYGMTEQDRLDMLNAQGNVCKLCDVPITLKTLNIDHDHKDGRVRGLLCKRCNIMLGYYEEITDHQRVFDYLKTV